MSDIVISNQTQLTSGFLKVEALTVEHPRFDGGSMTVRRELVRRKDCVSVLPFDPISEKIVLVEQFRIGAIDNPQGPFVFELIAGLVDKGETVFQAALREMREETGITDIVGEPTYLGKFFLSPGGCTEQTSLFLMPVLLDEEEVSRITSSAHGCANEGEDIRVHVLNLEDAVAFCQLNPSSMTTLAAIMAAKYGQK
ncbi:ADP-ribose pyrophosphatase [compost metagenome]